MSRQQLGAEFLLLVQCCHWNFLTASRNGLDVPVQLDWDLFVALARRHRVQGLAWNALARHDSLPAGAQETLSAEARSITATNLAIARECEALQRASEQAGIPVLFVKGITVGALGYRSPLLKMGWDIDLLIDPKDVESTARLLARCGYVVRVPRELDQLRSWHASNKESVWSREDCFHVELHTRLSDNRRLIPKIDVHSPRQEVEVAGIWLSTLAEDQLFAYLAVHGASSAWFRLKWISDFAALMHNRSGVQLERLYRLSQELGAGRAAGQAMLLADLLFDSMISAPALRAEIEADWAAKWLSRAALRVMTKDAGEPTDRRLGTLMIHYTQFFLRPELSFKAAELARQIIGLRIR